jgi:glutathione synthase/RimK-type ligase-like ATP-grasp enzyme
MLRPWPATFPNEIQAVTDQSPRIALASSARAPEAMGGEPLLHKALTERGAAPEWVVWNDPAADWPAYDLVVLRATWDYPDHIDAFRDWIRNPAVATRIVNPPNLVLPNLHKGYLADLGELAVPTVVVPAGMTIDLHRLRWASVVVKPAVAVGGTGAVRVRDQRDLDMLTLAPGGGVDVIVQPYLAGVERWGETSVVFIGGEPTHAVRKRAAEGEFRIHEHWGGTDEPITPADDEIDVGRATLATLRTVPAYARVDLIRDEQQRPRVVELELVEPYLWFEIAPHAADRLASLLMARIARHA